MRNVEADQSRATNSGIRLVGFAKKPSMALSHDRKARLPRHLSDVAASARKHARNFRRHSGVIAARLNALQILVSNLLPTQFTLAMDKTTGGAFLNWGIRHGNRISAA